MLGMYVIKRVLLTFVALCLLLAVVSGAAPQPVYAQEPDPVEEIMSRMSVEDKVGQLFIVPFVGAEANPGSDIWQLITEYRVGGVILLAANSNFNNDVSVGNRLLFLVTLRN